MNGTKPCKDHKIVLGSKITAEIENLMDSGMRVGKCKHCRNYVKIS